VNVLGLDTSTAASAACVLRADGSSFEEVPPPERLAGRPGHARELLPAAVAVMERSGLRWEELDSVAVGIGPGMFTGLRVGIATARALGQAHGAALRPVSSLDALAAGAGEGPVLALIDARRGEVFAAAYDAGVRLWGPWVGPPSKLLGRLPELLGPGSPVPRAVGDGSVRWSELLMDGGVETAPPESPLHVVRALQICRLAGTVPATPPEAVLPHYLRDPDAIPAR
jgi:tRNA threonylcarbamoyladenosine biosynthesis protein TsaB